MALCQCTDVNYCLIIKRKKSTNEHTLSVLNTVELYTYSKVHDLAQMSHQPLPLQKLLLSPDFYEKQI